MRYGAPRALALVGLWALAGCDPLATGRYAPPFLTIAGTIAGAATDLSTTHVRLALLWTNVVSASSYAAQPVAVRSEFPVQFTIDVKARPLDDVIYQLPANATPSPSLDPAMRWATAILVVYEDRDGDGTLTMADAPDRSPDRVLAAASDYDLFDLEAGRPASAELVGIFPTVPGFSLVHTPAHRDPLPGECGRFTAAGHFTELCEAKTEVSPEVVDPAVTRLLLTLTDDSGLQRFTCRGFWGPLEFPDWAAAPADQICDGGRCRFCQGYHCPLDLPGPGDQVTCAVDGTSYVYKRCVDDAASCGTRFCHFGHGERRAADPPPPGWPCR